MTMTKEQLIQIAKVGFPDRVKQFIDLENCEMHVMGAVYRLYDKDTPFLFALPLEYHISIQIEEKFIQFGTRNKSFNHFAAIKEMERLGLI